MKISKEKAVELSYKMSRDIEVLQRTSKNVNDLNDILMNYLISDVNYISVFQNGKPLYQSFYNTFIPQRDHFIEQYRDQVIEENTIKVQFDKSKNMFQILSRYALPKQKSEILAKRFDVYYYEFSIERDKLFIAEQSTRSFTINILWGVVLLVLLVIFLIVKFIRPLSHLSTATEQIAEGIHSPSSLQYSAIIHDEIFNLFVSFKKMAASIEQKNRELQEETVKSKEANQAKSTFLANMSHEIRTPLNAILGFITLLKKNETDKEKRNYLNIIDTSSHSLLSVINDILDLSKIENGKLDIVLDNFTLKECINNIIDLYRPRMSYKKINFLIELSDNLPKVIKSDELRIKQIINNLLSNALKFTPELGYISINVDYNHEGQHLKIKIKDSGIGIPKDKQAIIFQSFSQADERTTKNYGGTGLGLTIVSNLVSMLKGTVTLESEEGEGSCFTVELPASLVDSMEEEGSDEHACEIRFNREKVLLVEDNKTNQLFATLILDEINLSYDIANNGQEAVEMFQQHDYALILMDENMPVMNGTEATQKIIEFEKENNRRHTPIIALTANALKGDKEHFLNAGMDEYISKPINTLELAQKIKALLL